MFFEETAFDRCTELILMSLFRESTEKKNVAQSSFQEFKYNFGRKFVNIARQAL
jgi:hypothetical protein